MNYPSSTCLPCDFPILELPMENEVDKPNLISGSHNFKMPNLTSLNSRKQSKHLFSSDQLTQVHMLKLNSGISANSINRGHEIERQL